VPEASDPRYDEALLFAARAHAAVGQSRKGTRFPYVVHPIRVADIVDRYGYGPDAVVAAFLHDTVEDTDVTAAEVEAAFGPRVRELVEAVSEPEKAARWRVRKERTIASLEAGDDPEVLALTAADKLDNVRSTRDMLERFEVEAVWRRFSAPPDEQRWYYRTIAGVLLAKDPGNTLYRVLDRESAELFDR
jgi:guanosine-3',5'-bis(diphosphate) 3'-pyrophosphohydrolase